jgi:hypothetical protein
MILLLPVFAALRCSLRFDATQAMLAIRGDAVNRRDRFVTLPRFCANRRVTLPWMLFYAVFCTASPQ